MPIFAQSWEDLPSLREKDRVPVHMIIHKKIGRDSQDL